MSHNKIDNSWIDLVKNAANQVLGSPLISDISSYPAKYETLLETFVLDLFVDYNDAILSRGKHGIRSFNKAVTSLDGEQVNSFLSSFPSVKRLTADVLAIKVLLKYKKRFEKFCGQLEDYNVDVDSIKEAMRGSEFLEKDGLVFRVLKFTLDNTLYVQQIKALRKLPFILEGNFLEENEDFVRIVTCLDGPGFGIRCIDGNGEIFTGNNTLYQGINKEDLDEPGYVKFNNKATIVTRQELIDKNLPGLISYWHPLLVIDYIPLMTSEAVQYLQKQGDDEALSDLGLNTVGGLVFDMMKAMAKKKLKDMRGDYIIYSYDLKKKK